jgi:hypothetical protein
MPLRFRYSPAAGNELQDPRRSRRADRDCRLARAGPDEPAEATAARYLEQLRSAIGRELFVGGLLRPIATRTLEALTRFAQLSAAPRLTRGVLSAAEMTE